MKYTIWNTEFTFKKDAGNMMSSYLWEIQDYFKKSGDSEVLTDIEYAIVDKLEAVTNTRTDKNLVLWDVEQIMRELWTVEMITEQEDTTNNEIIVGKKLYRDIDDKIIAGVSSGIGHYFGINPWLVRLIFLGGLFLPFPSVIPYLILWFLLPMARTKTDILRMKGVPVSLSSLSQDSENYTSRRVMNLAKFFIITMLVFALFALSAFTAIFFISKNIETLSWYDETSYFYSCDWDNSQVDLKVTYPYMGNNISVWNGTLVFDIEKETEAYIGFAWESRIELEQVAQGKYIGWEYTLQDTSEYRTNPTVTKGWEEMFSECKVLSVQDTDGNFIDYTTEENKDELEISLGSVDSVSQ